MDNKTIYLILHNIRSAHNVGSMFRTADAAGLCHAEAGSGLAKAGVGKVFLTGYTPTPIDRFGRPQKEIAKTALGAEQSVPWEYRKHITPLINTLKQKGISVIALEQSSEAQHYKDASIEMPCALIVGNEVRGLSRATLQKCDTVIEIPMHGQKESLNVSVAAGIALFEFIDKRC